MQKPKANKNQTYEIKMSKANDKFIKNYIYHTYIYMHCVIYKVDVCLDVKNVNCLFYIPCI